MTAVVVLPAIKVRKPIYFGMTKKRLWLMISQAWEQR